jgi:hypothetical protein
MIRKILIIFLVLFSVMWFGIAYLLKVQVASQVESLKLGDMKLTYERISVTGFPAIWHVKIKEPRLKLASNNDHKEISSGEIECIFDLSFKKAKLVIYNKIVQEQDFGQEKIHYYLESKEPIITSLKFTKPFYKLSKNSNLLTSVKTFKLNDINLNATFHNEKIFNISNLTVNLNRIYNNDAQDISIKMQGGYEGQNYLLGFNSGHLKLDLLFTNAQNDANNIYKVNNFELDIDGDSKINLIGSLENSLDKLPEGRFFVVLSNYLKVIDKLVHPNFVVSRSTLKQVVARESKSKIFDTQSDNSIINNQTAFEINLTQEGIKIGSTNLFDIDKDNPDVDNEIGCEH